MYLLKEIWNHILNLCRSLKVINNFKVVCKYFNDIVEYIIYEMPNLKYLDCSHYKNIICIGKLDQLIPLDCNY